MKVKNRKSGEIETLRYGAAMEAVAAGTHDIVNEDDQGAPKPEKAKPSKAKA